MFTLTIETDNAAFQPEAAGDGEAEGYGATAGEVAVILDKLSVLLKRTAPDSAVGTLRDSNGNTVGSWRLS